MHVSSNFLRHSIANDVPIPHSFDTHDHVLSKSKLIVKRLSIFRNPKFRDFELNLQN